MRSSTSAGKLLAGSPGVASALDPPNDAVPIDYFILEPREGPPYYGVSVASEFHGKPAWVQVAFVASNIVFDSVLQEFLVDIAWIWIPFVFCLLGVNLVVARIGLRPLRSAARQATAIGPDNVSARLPEEGMPSEVLALVTAVNRALDRLEAEFGVQRAFIADAAHELRTPVAVLKAHVGILPQFAGIDALNEEVNALERLVNQLLDSARLDSLKVGPDDKADLNTVAADVAAYLAPLAIQRNRSIEVVSKGKPVYIRGAADFLFRALRNLVENAINHTPKGTTVKIIVDDPPVRQRRRSRPWRSQRRARSHLPAVLAGPARPRRRRRPRHGHRRAHGPGARRHHLRRGCRRGRGRLLHALSALRGVGVASPARPRDYDLLEAVSVL